MGFLFGKPKLDSGEFNRCLEYLGQHYKLTTFQDKEAEKYNETLTQYRNSVLTDRHSTMEVLKAAERLKNDAHVIVKRSRQLIAVPEPLGALHFAYQRLFIDYAAWADAQYAFYKAIAEDKPPFAERVQSLFYQQEESQKQTLKEEKKALQLLMDNGLTHADIQRLQDKAFAAVEAENWQPEESTNT